MYEQFCSLFEEAFDIVIGTIRPFLFLSIAFSFGFYIMKMFINFRVFDVDES